MDFMLTIVSEKNSPTLSVKMDSDAATLVAIRLMDIFADEVKFENGLVVKGRTYQQKTPRDTNLSPVTLSPVTPHLRKIAARRRFFSMQVSRDTAWFLKTRKLE